MDQVDVTIIGGGIAGSALAIALARAGRSVVVVEREAAFTDRVRGESMMPWGVAEAVELGVVATLVDAGGHTTGSWHRFNEAEDEPREIPVGLLVPGVAGTLNLGHPAACAALLAEAEAAGARVVRGARPETISVDMHAAELTVETEDGPLPLRTDLLVGADGRGSQVRRAIGIEMQRTAATAAIAGLLLDGVGGSGDHDVVVEHDHGMSLLLHQGQGRARAYHVVPAEDIDRYTGSSGAARFVADLAACPPVMEMLATARPAGPCATVPNVQTWTELPASGCAVLIGDAAGQSDPSVGCGLSVAMRDVRIVRDLVLDGAAHASDFASYGTERVERMALLRAIAHVMVDSVVRPGPDRSERRASFAQAMATFDPEVFPLVLGMFAGPETVPIAAV